MFLLLIAIVVLIGAINSLEFNYIFGDGAFQRDYFRHFNLNVIPLINGSGDATNLFLNHHSSPLLHFHQIVAMWISDGSLRGNAYVGIVLFSLTALYLGVIAFQDLAAHTNSKWYGLTIACAVVLVISGLTAAEPVVNPLIYLQGYFFVLGVTVAALTYFLCTQPMSGKRVSLYICIVLATIVLHSSYGTLFAYASATAIAIQALTRSKYRLLAPMLIIILLAYIWNTHVLPSLGHHNPPRADPLVYLHNNLAEVPFIIAAFGMSLLAGFHGDAYTFNLTRDTLHTAHTIGFLGVAFTYTSAMLWALCAPRKVMIAGIIMLAMLLAAAAVPLTRWGSSFPYKLDAVRYIFMYKFAAAAFVWAAADALGSCCRQIGSDAGKNARTILFISIALSLLICIAVLQNRAYRTLKGNAAYFFQTQINNELAVYMLGVDASNSYSLHKWFSGFNKPLIYAPVIEWIAKVETNVFSPDYRGTRQLKHYKQARAVYLSSNAIPEPLPMHTGNCHLFPEFTERRAWKLDIEPLENKYFSLTFMDRGDEKIEYPYRIGRQVYYGIFPAGTRIRLCFPSTTLINSATHLPAATEPG